MTEPRRGTPPWVWAVVGCGAGCLLLVGGCVALGAFGTIFAKRAADRMTDPASRLSAAEGVLGTSELPPGFSVEAALSIPFLFDMVVLTDRSPDQPPLKPEASPAPAPEVDTERAFVYLSFPSFGDVKAETEAFLDGTSDRPPRFGDSPVELDPDEVIGRGTLTFGDRTSRYATFRGAVQYEEDRRARDDGLTTLSLLDCDDRRVHLALWIGPEEKSGPSWVEDEEALESFLGHFAPCG